MVEEGDPVLTDQERSTKANKSLCLLMQFVSLSIIMLPIHCSRKIM